MPKKSRDIARGLKNAKNKAVDTIKLLKFHKTHDKFALNCLRDYIAKETFKEISKKIKQGKAKIDIERKDYSFLISGRDLLPKVISEYLPEETINRFIEKRFLEEKYEDFSGMAWTFIPEYIGPMLPADKRAKLLLTLSLFSPRTKINFVDYSNNSKRLIWYASLIGKTSAKASNKPEGKYGINMVVNLPRIGGFEKMIHLETKIVHLKQGDMEFIKHYVQNALKIEVEFPENLKKKLREELWDLAVASARMEMRSIVTDKDIDRITGLNL